MQPTLALLDSLFVTGTAFYMTVGTDSCRQGARTQLMHTPETIGSAYQCEGHLLSFALLRLDGVRHLSEHWDLVVKPKQEGLATVNPLILDSTCTPHCNNKVLLALWCCSYCYPTYSFSPMFAPSCIIISTHLCGSYIRCMVVSMLFPALGPDS